MIARKLGILLFIVILFYCLDYYFRISPSLVVPQLMAQYQVGTLGLGSFASAFYTGYLLFQIPTGILLDRCRFNKLMSLAILICTFGFMFFVIDTHEISGYFARLVIGAASAFSFIGALYFARYYLPPTWFTLISGFTISAGTLSASLAQIISAYAMQYFSWHQVFNTLACSGVILSLLLLLPSLQLRHHTPTHVASPPIFRTLLSLLKSQRFVINALLGGLFYLPTTIFASLWGIPFLESTYHLSPSKASTGITLLFLGWAMGAPLIGFLMSYTRHFSRFITLGACLGGLTCLPLIYAADIVQSWVFLLLFLFGLFSSAQVIVWKVFREICPRPSAGLGISLTNMLIMAFGAVFHLIVGWMLSLGFFNTTAGSIDYRVGLSLLPLAFFIVMLVSFFLKSAKLDKILS